METETIIIDSKNRNIIDNITLEKMKFIYNGIINGWSVKMNDNKFIFTKKHEGKKEVFSENYISNFVKNNLK